MSNSPATIKTKFQRFQVRDKKSIDSPLKGFIVI